MPHGRRISCITSHDSRVKLRVSNGCKDELGLSKRKWEFSSVYPQAHGELNPGAVQM